MLILGHPSLHDFVRETVKLFNTRSYEFAKKVKSRLESSPDSVMSELESLRRRIVDPSKAMVYMAADLDLTLKTHGHKAASLWR